jgi:riboflavin biosynthesis pyrimidine reductase
LVEAGASVINELIDEGKIDRLELSVTQVTGGDDKIDIEQMLSHFNEVSSTNEGETIFYTARRK